jgi:uncharacterized membrane protein
MNKKPSDAKESRLTRLLATRRRLLLSVAAGAGLLAVLPGSLRPETRYLLAWDLTAALYVGFALWMIFRSTVQTCRSRAALYDQSDWVIVGLVVIAAAASFGAIFSEIAAIKSSKSAPPLSLLLTAATVAMSWTFTHVVFTLHYANLYYRPADGRTHGGLVFPGERAPDYRDFLYYSFVIGCAAQTADVATVSRAMRLVSLAHGIVAFAFNTAILALAINVVASLLA